MSYTSQQQPKFRNGVSSSLDITDGASKRKSLTTKARLRMRTLSDDLTDPGSVTLRSPYSSPEQRARISIDKAVPTPLSLDCARSRPRSATLGDLEKVFSSPTERARTAKTRKNNLKEQFQLESQQASCVYTSSELFLITCSLNASFPMSRDGKGDLPIHTAVSRKDANLVVVSQLLKAYPQGARTKNAFGEFPLFVACAQEHVHAGVIGKLLAAFPEAASYRHKGNLALHVLALRGGLPSPEAVKTLLQANPEAVRTENNHGNVPLHYLCAVERPSLDTLAVRIMMDAFPEGVMHVNKVGMTPIDLALSRLKLDVSASPRLAKKLGTVPPSVAVQPADSSDGMKSSIRAVPAVLAMAMRPRSTSCPSKSAFFEQAEALEASRVGSEAWLRNFRRDTDLHERTRILLISAPSEFLTPKQAVLLRDMHWRARKGAFEVAAAHVAGDTSCGLNLCDLRDCHPGLWRLTLSFL